MSSDPTKTHYGKLAEAARRFGEAAAAPLVKVAEAVADHLESMGTQSVGDRVEGESGGS